MAGFGQTGPQPKPNNSLVISNNPASGPYFRFFCRSNSLTMGVGELIGLDESPVTANNSFFGFQTTTIGGELRVVSTVSLLTDNEQGVYTCRMPLEGGGEGEINIGIYPSEFGSELSNHEKSFMALESCMRCSEVTYESITRFSAYI